MTRPAGRPNVLLPMAVQQKATAGGAGGPRGAAKRVRQEGTEGTVAGRRERLHDWMLAQV